MAVSIYKIITNPWEENSYIVYDEHKTAIFIDPGNSPQEIEKYIEAEGLNPKAILNTHAHLDHFGAVKHLKEKYNIPFYLHSKDERLLKQANLYLALFKMDQRIEIPVVDKYLDEVKELKFENLSIYIDHTPGHTDGCVCFTIENHIFTGDTLLNGEVGRVDLPGGKKSKLIQSLNFLAIKPKDLLVEPGHGVTTTIGEQLETNTAFKMYIDGN